MEILEPINNMGQFAAELILTEEAHNGNGGIGD